MTSNAEIIVVSGLPRSGTSLMMAMLRSGGISILTDEQRTADTDNPKGYYELERVKQLKNDSSWIPEARGKAVKVVSPLLYDLPTDESYQVLFMQRDLDEVIASQEKMLQRRDQPAAPANKIKGAFEIHLDKLFNWLPKQTHISLLPVSYNELMSDAESVIGRITGFIQHPLDPARMHEAIDPTLYRNRNDEAGR